MKNYIHFLFIIIALASIASINAAESVTPAQEFLSYMGGLKKFHSSFRELSTPQARIVLTPKIDNATLDAIVNIVEKNKPTLLKSHFLQYSPDFKDQYKLLLEKIALMTHHPEIVEKFIHTSNLDLKKDAFFISIYEADLTDIPMAQKFIKMLNLVDINNTDDLGFTPVAVAAVIKESPELTETVLKLKPNLNYMMDVLYEGKMYSGKRSETYKPTQAIKTKTVLDLVDNALVHEKQSEIHLKLAEIYEMLLQAGAKSADEIQKEAQLTAEELAFQKSVPASNPTNVVKWDFSDDED